MPKWAEKKAEKQGGVKGYKMMKKNGKLYRCMITKKSGEREGHTVCYEV
jgi:hypothetical protein